jgi:hypothetical protein
VPVEFQKGANGQALVQRLRVKANMFEYDGEYYCGFKFTVPTWIDGDFEWMHVLAKTEAKKDFSATLFQWYIIPPSGQSKGFENFMRHDLASFPLLKQQFPYTHMIFTQYLDKSRLEPGKTYAIGFGFVQKDMPDIAFAMTITSKRGSDEFGALPLR